MTDASESATRERAAGFLAGMAYGMAALIFLPVSIWMVGRVMTDAQLLQSFAILILAGVGLVLFNKEKSKLVMELSRPAMILLGLAFLFTVVATVTGQPLLTLAGYGAAGASAILYVWGPRRLRTALLFMLIFGGWVAFALSFDRFDWPLRELAGQWAAFFLSLLGQAAQLIILDADGEAQLRLIVNDRPFLVAPECNGFGLLSSSLLLTLLLTVYRQFSQIDRLLYVAVGGVIGFLGNIVRIVLIVLLAPYVGEHYHLMHEIVGTGVYLAALGTIWYLAQTHGQKNRTEAT